VEKGELDLGLIIEPHATRNTEVLILSEDRFQLYESRLNKPIYKDLKTAPLIFMPDALAGRDNSRLLTTHPNLENENPRRLYKTSSLESAKELVRKGIGLALLPEFVARPDIEKGWIARVDVDGFPKKGMGPHRLGLLYARHKADSPTLKGLIEALQEAPFYSGLKTE
jgi:DNA-binding transcriptional LysR family regulator